MCLKMRSAIASDSQVENFPISKIKNALKINIVIYRLHSLNSLSNLK